MDMVFCIDYLLNQFQFFDQVSEHTYGFILNTEGDLYYHPAANQSQELQSPDAIEIPEFFSNYKTERRKFNETIVPLFGKNTTEYKIYDKNDEKNIIAVSPIWIRL